MTREEITKRILEIKLKKGIKTVKEKLQIQKLQQKLEEFFNKK